MFAAREQGADTNGSSCRQRAPLLPTLNLVPTLDDNKTFACRLSHSVNSHTMSSDLIIVGAGVFGLSTAIAAARKGYSVDVFDRELYDQSHYSPIKVRGLRIAKKTGRS